MSAGSVFYLVGQLCHAAGPETLVPKRVTSPDIHLTHPTLILADEDAIYGNRPRLVDLGDLPHSADVDAIHGLPDGDVLFSLKTSALLGDTLYFPCDVIRYSGGAWTKEFDGRTAGIPAGVNIDALAVSGERLLFSTDIDAVLGGITVSDADVIAFDGVDFSIFLEASGTGLDAAADVDALHINAQERLSVSLDGTGEVDGVKYQDEFLLDWNSGWSIRFEHPREVWIPANLDAWSIVFIDDNLFSNGFEQE